MPSYISVGSKTFSKHLSLRLFVTSFVSLCDLEQSRMWVTTTTRRTQLSSLCAASAFNAKRLKFGKYFYNSLPIMNFNEIIDPYGTFKIIQ